MDIAHSSALPDHIRRVNPGPDELPDDRGPPFPTLVTLEVQLCFSSLHTVVPETPARVELLGAEKDEQRDRDLMLSKYTVFPTQKVALT
jgi:hypothetical protein